ncbi:transposase, partial [Flavobacterium xanthum]|uniref:transposase n=1 Tax=Flavobacterium xanthum TaxID=69322 RepID=UPI001587EBDB
AISNNRIQSIDNQNVTFTYKDYRQNGFKKQMTLTHEEFIRRFALHILPKRFVKIRHYGFLSSTWKREKLKVLQEKLQVKVLEKIEKKPFLPKCPCCKTGNLHRIAVFDQRGPPAWYLGDSQSSSSCES